MRSARLTKTATSYRFLLGMWTALSILVVTSGCADRPDPDVGKFSHSHAEVKARMAYAFTQPNVDQDSVDVDLVEIDVTFTGPDGTTRWTAPRDSHTDWASIPDALLSLVGRPDSEKIARPALIHDAFCQEFRNADGTTIRSPNCRSRPWEETHLMFYDACVASGASEGKDRLWWVAVHVGGPRWDANGKPIENGLQSISREVIYALLYGPDGQRKMSTPSKEEMDLKLATFDEAANAVIEARNQAISFARVDSIEACREVVDEAIRNLDDRATVDEDNGVVYTALRGKLTVEIARELEGTNPDVALVQYGRAAKAFQGIRRHKELGASATERIANVNVAEALAHKRLGNSQLANEKLDAACEEVVRLRAFDLANPIPSSLESQIESARGDQP